MTDMTERKFYNDLDAAGDFWTITDDSDAHAPGFDEWNAIRIATGQPVGEWGDYLADINRTE